MQEGSSTIILRLFGIGALEARIFSEAFYPIHGLLGMAAFLFGGLAAVSSFWLLRPSMRCISLALGMMSLVALLLDLTVGGYTTPGGIESPLGVGGMERLGLHPIVLWLVGFGAVLMASPDSLTGPRESVPKDLHLARACRGSIAGH